MGGINLGGLASGFESGMGSMESLRQKAMQIKQAQFDLDQQKQKVAAEAQRFAPQVGADMGGMPGAQQVPPGAQGAPPAGPGGVQPFQPPPMGAQPGPPPGPGGVAPMGGQPPQAPPQPQGPPPGAAPPQGMGGVNVMGNMAAAGVQPQGAPQGQMGAQGNIGPDGGQDPVMQAYQAQRKIESMLVADINARYPRSSPEHKAILFQDAMAQFKQQDPLLRAMIMGQSAEAVANRKAQAQENVAAGNNATKREITTMTLGERGRESDQRFKSAMAGVAERLQSAKLSYSRGVTAASIAANARVKSASLAADASKYHTDAYKDVHAAAMDGSEEALKLQSKIEKTDAGKTWARNETAGTEVETLALAPDITKDPAKQIGMINRYLYQTTGSTRPPISELQKITGLSTKDAKDVLDSAAALAAGKRTLLGKDQIANILSSSRAVRDGAMQNAMSNPGVAGAISRVKELGAGSVKKPNSQAPAANGGWSVVSVK